MSRFSLEVDDSGLPNSLADISAEEFERHYRLCGGRHSLVETPPADILKITSDDLIGLPVSVNYTNKGAVTGVKDQGR